MACLEKLEHRMLVLLIQNNWLQVLPQAFSHLLISIWKILVLHVYILVLSNVPDLDEIAPHFILL